METIPEIQGSSTEIRESLHNIMLNAIEAMPLGGSLTIASAKEDDMIVIEVSDTGNGMADDTKAGIFKPFQTNHGECLGSYRKDDGE